MGMGMIRFIVTSYSW